VYIIDTSIYTSNQIPIPGNTWLIWFQATFLRNTAWLMRVRLSAHPPVPLRVRKGTGSSGRAGLTCRWPWLLMCGAGPTRQWPNGRGFASRRAPPFVHAREDQMTQGPCRDFTKAPETIRNCLRTRNTSPLRQASRSSPRNLASDSNCNVVEGNASEQNIFDKQLQQPKQHSNPWQLPDQKIPKYCGKN